MEGTLPPKDQAAPEPVSVDALNQPEAPSLGAAYSVLRALVGDRMPKGPLGPDTVPAAMLALPIATVTEDLVQHLKKCQKLPCPYVPPPLQPYRRMRPDAIRNAKEQVHKVLWTHPDHELVARVRKEILEQHAALANDISTGKLLSGDRLGEVLNELGPNGPRVLGAVLWAAEFKGVGAEAIFRILVPLVEAGAPRRPEPDRVVTSVDGRMKSLKAKLRTLLMDRKRAKRTAEQATHDLQLKERALARSQQELENAQRMHRDLATQLDTVQKRLREISIAYRSLEQDAAKGAKVNTALRKDLRELQQTQAEFEVGRSDLARQLAAERRRLERLKLQLAATPHGSDAVIAFLHSEEERIKTDRSIRSGGAKERAEQEWRVYRKLKTAFFEAYPEYRQPPPVKIRPKSSLRLLALGGSGEIGRSCYLIELGKHRILVDCGIKPGAGEDLHPQIERLERPDALILTHAHTDHVGWVPALVRRFPDLDIYCSDGTAALLPVMLEDCHQHYMRRMVAQRERGQYIHNASVVEEDYDLGDVHAVSKLLIECSFTGEEPLPFAGATIRFYKAGHVLGASSVLIEDESGRRIFLSGDFSSFPQLTVPAAEWPQQLGDVDLLVLESTYGDRTHKPLNDSRRAVISFVSTTLQGGGSVILASFGLGRAQELLKLLTIARDNGELPAARVYVDGMIKRINPIYRQLASFDPPPEAFYEVSGENERQEVVLAAQKTPSIIVTTSGMLSGGPVVHYARHLLPDPRHRLVLTGYQDRGAPSRALREVTSPGRRLVTLEDERGEPVSFEAAMPAKEVGLSAHADQPGLIEYASRMRPKHIALVHGETDAQRELRRSLLEVHPGAEIVCGPTELQLP